MGVTGVRYALRPETSFINTTRALQLSHDIGLQDRLGVDAALAVSDKL